MHRNLLPVLTTCLCLSLWACENKPPTEAEVKQRLVGNYCAEGYFLRLTDSTYYQRHSWPGAIGAAEVHESCRGTYTLKMDSLQHWHIHFAEDEWPRAMENCGAEWVLWTPEDGYLYTQKDTVALPDLFDQKLLIKGDCQQQATKPLNATL